MKISLRPLGLERVPVHVAADLSPAQIKAYRIADNKTAELAEWDWDLLPLELADLQEADYDLGSLGFAAAELGELLGSAVREGLCDPDEIPAPPATATTRRGDVWLLGEHRLRCGDSASAEDLDRLLAGATVHLVHTDPPYNVKVEPRSNNAIAAGRGRGGTHHQSFDAARRPRAAKQTGRRAYLMELDPLYCDVIVARWEQFTGERARRENEPPPRRKRPAAARR